MVIMIVQLGLFLWRQVAPIQSEAQMNFRFRSLSVTVAELADECGLVSSLTPGFGDVRAYRPGRPPNLVDQGKLLVGGPRAAQSKNFHRRVISQFVHPQLFVIRYAHSFLPFSLFVYAFRSTLYVLRPHAL